MNPDRTLPGDWFSGTVPENVALAPDAYLETTYSFQLFCSRTAEAIRIGRGSSIYLGVMFDLGPGGRVEVGQFTLMNGARIICDSQISIGDHCLISWNVVLMDSYRLPFDRLRRRRELERASMRQQRRIESSGSARPIQIGDNVWIGFDVCILPGVTIGEGAVIGAHSVVAADVAPLTLAAGNPARVIRELEPEEVKQHA